MNEWETNKIELFSRFENFGFKVYKRNVFFKTSQEINENYFGNTTILKVCIPNTNSKRNIGEVCLQIIIPQINWNLKKF